MNDLIEQEKSERGLTPKQEKFVTLVEGGMDLYEAKKEAGYAAGVSLPSILKPLKSQLQDLIDARLMEGSVKSVNKLLGVLDDPTKPGNKELLQAIGMTLDRVGVTKERAAGVNVNVEVAPVVYLPEKKTLELNKDDFIDITPEED